jgi:phosphatidylserine/phosphatidylglycerophosphate/cardiolipin synthase-like enzyme
MPVSAALSIRTLFAPFDDTAGAFLRFVAGAQHSIDTQIYGFHLPALTDTLIAKHAAGVRVSLILDHTQESGKAEGSEVARLVAAGVPLLIGTSPVHRQILHSKFTVVDGESVEHGSWNYSLSASQQSNDMHFVEGSVDYAAAYLRHHDRIRSFILLHEMAMQLAGETMAGASLPVVASTTSDPVSAPVKATGKTKAAAVVAA